MMEKLETELGNFIRTTLDIDSRMDITGYTLLNELCSGSLEAHELISAIEKEYKKTLNLAERNILDYSVKELTNALE